jgi:hypothetical protein
MFPHPGVLFEWKEIATFVASKAASRNRNPPQLFPTFAVSRGRLTESGKMRTDRDSGSCVILEF